MKRVYMLGLCLLISGSVILTQAVSKPLSNDNLAGGCLPVSGLDAQMAGTTDAGGTELSGEALERCRQKLAAFLLNKRLVSKVTMPACKDGIDLHSDGSFDLKRATRMIKEHGVGVEVGEAATVTNIALKGKHIEIHLNGGGYGTLGDILMDSRAKRERRDAGTGKAPGGSRINLRFDRPITEADIDDQQKLAGYLEVVVDTSALRQDAMRQNIAAEFRDAAARGEVLPGMDKQTVFAILGEPKNKSVDLSTDPPTEKWQYEMKDFKTRVVTFKGGKVTRVDEF